MVFNDDDSQPANKGMNDATMARSILVVDDEENLLLLLQRVLGKDGYRVCVANGSYQALALIEDHSFSAAIVDIKMFPIDGVALLGEIKQRSPSTQVVMITGYPTETTREECLRRGATAFMTKPLDIQKLKSIIHELAS